MASSRVVLRDAATDIAANRRRHAATAASACLLLALAAGSLLAMEPWGLQVEELSAASHASTVHLVGGHAAAAGAAVKAKASARLAAKSMSAAAGEGAGGSSKGWANVMSKVHEAAKERMLQLSAMMKQQHESDDAMSNAVQEERQYDVLSFRPSPSRRAVQDVSEDSQKQGPRQAALDASQELARYSEVASSGADAYAADKQFLKLEKRRSENPRNKVIATPVPVLNAASDLLARYGKLASAGVTAYHSDSNNYQSRAQKESQYESRHGVGVYDSTAPPRVPVKIGTPIHVLSPTLHWRSAKVEGNEAGHVLVHYDGYKHKYDEWIPAQSHRIQGLSQMAAAGQREESLQDKAKQARDEVAREFSEYQDVAVSGQKAYHDDAKAAADNNRKQQDEARQQYVLDQVRSEHEAQKASERYSMIARLGTPEDARRVAHAGVTMSSSVGAQANVVSEKPASTSGSGASATPSLSVVQAAAQAAANAAATVVNEATEAVDEVEGTQTSTPEKRKERPQEHLRAKSGGAKHGRGRLGSSTERTYAEVERQLSLASQTARAEGNVAVSKQVAQEQRTLGKLRKVPGVLPERVQHNLVSAGASLLRRLGIGAGAKDQRPQATPMTPNDDNAVLSVASVSEGPASVKRRVMLHLHQLHSRAHALQRKALQQRLSEEGSSDEEAKPVAVATDASHEATKTEDAKSSESTATTASTADAAHAAESKEATAAAVESKEASAPVESKEASPVGEPVVTGKEEAKSGESVEQSKEGTGTVEKDSAAEARESQNDEEGREGQEGQEEGGKQQVDGQMEEDKPAGKGEKEEGEKEEGEKEEGEKEEGEKSEEERPADVQPTVQVRPPLSREEENQRRGITEEQEHEHEHGHAGPKEHDHFEDNRVRRVATPGPGEVEYGEKTVGKEAEADGCWVPELPMVRKALCSFSERKDGTCEEVWGDIPEITGAVEAFALRRVHAPDGKLHLRVMTAPYTQMAPRDYGTITVGLQKRSDGAVWMYRSRRVANTRPWTTIGLFENAPDMMVQDCDGGFLGVISMDSAEDEVVGSELREKPRKEKMYGGHEAEAEEGEAAGKPDQHIRAEILGPTGTASLTMVKGTLDILGDDEGDARYHVYTTDTRRLVCVMEKRMQHSSDWVIRLEKDGPLDIRVAGILAAQIEGGWMHKEESTMKTTILVIAAVVLALLLLFCLAPIVMRWWSQARSKQPPAPAMPDKRAEDVEMPHTAGPSGYQRVEAPSRTRLAEAPSRARVVEAPDSPRSNWSLGSSRGLTARSEAAETQALSSGLGSDGDRRNFGRADFWDRLPIGSARGVDNKDSGAMTNSTAHGSTHVPSMAPLMQAASLRGLPQEEKEKVDKVRSALDSKQQRGGGGGGDSGSATPRGWRAASFRETPRSYREPGDMEIRDVLKSVLEPLSGGDTSHRPESMRDSRDGARRPKSLREWAEKYNYNMPEDEQSHRAR